MTQNFYLPAQSLRAGGSKGQSPLSAHQASSRGSHAMASWSPALASASPGRAQLVGSPVGTSRVS